MSQENQCEDVFAQLNTIEELQNKLAFQQQCQALLDFEVVLKQNEHIYIIAGFCSPKPTGKTFHSYLPWRRCRDARKAEATVLQFETTIFKSLAIRAKASTFARVLTVFLEIGSLDRLSDVGESLKAQSRRSCP